MRISKRIILFTGAGASTGFGYPTTEQFINGLKAELSSTQYANELILLNKILTLQNFKDVEHVLELLDLLQGINRHPFSSFIERFNTVINFDGNTRDMREVLKTVKILRDKIQEDVFRQYEFNPKTIPKINEEYLPLVNYLLEHSDGSELSIFTTNYDRVVENLCLQNKLNFVDGFKRIDNSDEFEWDFNEYIKSSSKEDLHLIRLYKLHGSLNWRERSEDNKIVRVSPEELTRGSRRYNKNFVIYPAEKFKPESEPFKKLHESFENGYSSCDTAIFLGFAFRDDYLKSIVTERAYEKQIIIIRPHASDYVEKNKKDFSSNLIPIDHSFGEDTPKLISKLDKILFKGN